MSPHSPTGGPPPTTTDEKPPSSSAMPQPTPHPAQSGISIAVFAFALAASFFTPWMRLDTPILGVTLYRVGGMGVVFSFVPVLALATFALRRNRVWSRRLGTITAIATWFAVLYCFIKSATLGSPGLLRGESLALLISLGLFAVAGERRLTAPADYVAKKLNSRKGDAYAHWFGVMANVHFSSQEFYAKIEADIRTKQWPDVQMLRVQHTEAGALSHKREYLRVIRQRQFFDICAAPYGIDYFFSLREAEIPAVVTLRMLFAATLGLAVLSFMAVQTLGFFLGPFSIVFFMVVAVWFFFIAGRMGMTKVDAALMKLPVFGAIYVAWFRKETYFQQDTRLIFLKSVDALVRAHVEQTISEKGIRFFERSEKQPVMEGLYKSSRTRLGADGQPVAA